MNQPSQFRRAKSREAIALATKGRWQDAVVANRSLLEVFPEDVEALNRLGKALSETGRYAEARQALGRALQLAPANSIARKNRDRIAGMEDAPSLPQATRLAPQVFLDESGKSITTALVGAPPATSLGLVSNGDVVHLTVDGATVAVSNGVGQRLGQLEPKLASRFIRLEAGGNSYVAAVASVTPEAVSIVVRETYQSSAMSGVVAFPPTGKRAPAYVPDIGAAPDDELDLSGGLSWSVVGEDGADEDTDGELQLAPKSPRAVHALHDSDNGDDEDPGDDE